MDYQKYSKEVYGLEVRKGRWDGSPEKEIRNLEEVQAHGIAELSEAVGALMKGRFSPDVSILKIDDPAFKDTFESNYKDTFEDEMADSWLVFMVGLGRLNYELNNYDVPSLTVEPVPFVGYAAFTATQRGMAAPNRITSKVYWVGCAKLIEELARRKGIDLEAHIKLKMRYNELREMKY